MKSTTLTFLLLLLQQTTSAGIFKANNFFPQKATDSIFVTSNDVSWANINDDGLGDLVVSVYADQGLIIYLGHPEGGFTELFTTPLIGIVHASSVFDADGDGDSDIWVTTSTSDEDFDLILINENKGLFSKKVITNKDNYEFRFVNEIHTGDIDNDGDLDLIKSINDNQSFWDLGPVAQVFINDGDGNFHMQENTYIIEQFSHLEDFNNDGYLDLISGYSNLMVYYNNQSGSFDDTAQEFQLNIPFGFCHSIISTIDNEQMLFEDIDNDGDMDIQAISKKMNLPRRINNGDGTFSASGDEECATFESYPGGFLTNLDFKPIQTGLFIDINQDGLKDLWLSNNDKQNSKVTLTGANGQLTEQVQEFEELQIQYSVTGDFNQDKQTDVITLGFQGINQWLFENPMNFIKTDLSKINQQWGYVHSPVATDFDGDEMSDLLYSQQNGLYYRSGNGAGAFGEPIQVLPLDLRGVQVIDFNKDGLKDLIGVKSKVNENFLIDYYFTVALKDELTGYQIIEFPLGQSQYGVNYDISDFDADGDFDLIAVVSDDIHIFQNQGNQNFELIQQTEDKWYSGLQFVDLNKQNRAAFVAYNRYDFSEQTDEGFHEWVWNGESFELFRTAKANRQESTFVFEDYDDDGDWDILTTTRIDNDHRLLVVNETDSFSLSQFAYPGGAIEFASDLNLDGKIDYIDRDGSVFLSQGDDQFIVDTTNSDMGGFDLLVDLDADGDLDSVATSAGLQTHLNQTNHIEFSGLWYNPEQQGHGLSLEQLVVGGEPSVLFSWFAFHQQKPFWLIGMAPINGNQAQIDVVSTSGTGFGSAFNSQDIIQSPWGVVDISLLDEVLSVSWQPTESGFDSGQMQMQRLSVVKEPTAQPHVMNSCHSGSWFNSDQDGHGLFVQVINQNGQDTLLVSWYHYAENEQYWMVGQGPIQGQQATTTLYSGEGGLFPPHFETADADLQPWGELSFKLLSDSTAVINWVSDKPGFEDGQLHLEKLTQLDRYHCAE